MSETLSKVAVFRALVFALSTARPIRAEEAMVMVAEDCKLQVLPLDEL